MLSATEFSSDCQAGGFPINVPTATVHTTAAHTTLGGTTTTNTLVVPTASAGNPFGHKSAAVVLTVGKAVHGYLLILLLFFL